MINTYKVSDTLYFISNLNDVDTIRITSIDTLDMARSESISSMPHIREIALKIDYLPIKKSYDGYITNRKGEYDSIGPQPFIHVEGQFPGAKYLTTTISLKDFESEITFIPNKNYYILKNQSPLKQKQNKPKDLKEVYWSICNGLEGYKTNDGEKFKRR